jgi:2'-hydroxyisoflavone reductase
MRLLIIGGTQFVGRHLTDMALAAGHQVTHFNRGQTNPQPIAGVDTRRGDRQGDLSALASGDWDAVIDTCGYRPADVQRMADLLHGRVKTYVFVSSISVYASFETPNSESSALGQLEGTDTADGRTYGPLKALCEAAVRARFGDAHSLILRPGLLVGPFDPTQRFTYWPVRVARAAAHEPVLAPGSPADAVQFMDARDLCAFILQCLESGRLGVFNVASPPGHWTLGELLDTCATVSACSPRWVWITPQTIERLELAPWSDLPVWVPATGEHAAFMRNDVSHALQAGLTLRPLIETVRDTLQWFRSLPPEAQTITRAGLNPEREAAILQQLQALPA